MNSSSIDYIMTLKPNVMTMKVKQSPELYNVFMTKYPWAKTIGEAIYCERNKIKEQPLCGVDRCSNPVKFITSGNRSKYSKGCCQNHSSLISTRERYGVDHPAQNSDVRNKMKTTLMERYGVDHNMKSPETRSKFMNTLMGRYGVDSPAKIDEVKKENRKKMFEKYRNKFSDMAVPLFTPDEYIDARAEYQWKCMKCGESFYDLISTSFRNAPICPHCHPRGTSRPEKEIYYFIQSMGINVILNSRKIIPPMEIDIHVPSHNLSIEYDGLYWHGELNGGSSNKHIMKTEAIEATGGRLLHIFEDEWLNKKAIVQSMIKAKLGKLPNRVYARNCSIIEVPTFISRLFFNENHIQGWVPSTVTYGLEHKGKLIACMSFGKSRFNKKIQFELLRFSTLMDYHCIGGSSKLFTHFIKIHNPESIISYADRRYSKGEMYSTLGFTYTHTSNPNYQYFRNGFAFRESRMKFQKHKLPRLLPIFDPNETEWENMRANGYDRIWDCGSLVYEWHQQNLFR